jgi:two-component system NtrC family sensor kinase
MEKSRPYYRSLTRRMVLIVIVVSFTPLVLISAIIGYRFHSSYHEKAVAQLQELVLKHKQNIDSFLVERLADIRMLARSYDMDRLGSSAFLQKQLTVLQEENRYVFVDIGLVDAGGIQVAYAGPYSLSRADYAEADWFKKAQARSEFISDVFMGLRGSPHFIVAVRKEWEGLRWILRSTVDFQAFNRLVESIQIGETGFALILNHQGELQTRERLEVVLNRGPLLEVLRSPGMPENRVQVVEKKNDAGTPYIYVMTPLKGGDWLLAFQQNHRDAFSDLYEARKLAAIIFLSGCLGIITTTFALTRRMVRRIEQADREKDMMNEQVIEAGKLASLGELAAGIAHEINNPVAIMVEEAGWIEDLLEEAEFKKSENLGEFERALKQIRHQGTRCKEITHKLLSFARKTDPREQEIQLNDVIREVLALSEQRARYSKIQLYTELTPDLPAVTVSTSEMQQVFLNFVNNALDAMEKSGGTLTITSRIQDRHVVVDIADTGPGIPAANLQKIFDPFFTTKPVGKGTGLGLSICYGIINKLGGRITVNSGTGLGTAFHIWIPLPDRKNMEKVENERRIAHESGQIAARGR